MPYVDGARVLGVEWAVGDLVRCSRMPYTGTVVGLKWDAVTIRLDEKFLGRYVHDFMPHALLYAGKHQLLVSGRATAETLAEVLEAFTEVAAA